MAIAPGEIPGTIEEEIDKDLEAIVGETPAPDLTAFDFESLKNDPTAKVRYKGETWNIYDLIRFNPHNFDESTDAGLRAMQLWINELMPQQNITAIMKKDVGFVNNNGIKLATAVRN